MGSIFFVGWKRNEGLSDGMGEGVIWQIVLVL